MDPKLLSGPRIRITAEHPDGFGAVCVCGCGTRIWITDPGTLELRPGRVIHALHLALADATVERRD